MTFLFKQKFNDIRQIKALDYSWIRVTSANPELMIMILISS